MKLCFSLFTLIKRYDWTFDLYILTQNQSWHSTQKTSRINHSLFKYTIYIIRRTCTIQTFVNSVRRIALWQTNGKSECVHSTMYIPFSTLTPPLGAFAASAFSIGCDEWGCFEWFNDFFVERNALLISQSRRTDSLKSFLKELRIRLITVKWIESAFHYINFTFI